MTGGEGSSALFSFGKSKANRFRSGKSTITFNEYTAQIIDDEVAALVRGIEKNRRIA